MEAESDAGLRFRYDIFHQVGKLNEAVILKPALSQLDDLNAALQRSNPAMLAVNKAIADASEQSYKVATLQTRGLLDADACSAKLRDINAKLTELRRERRCLLQNEDLEDMMDALRQTADIVQTGPDRLEGFDEAMFSRLIQYHIFVNKYFIHAD